MALFGRLAGLTVDPARRAYRKLKPDGIVQILADEYLGIDLFKTDVLELLCYDAGVGHGERPGPAGLGVLAGRGQILQNDLLRTTMRSYRRTCAARSPAL